MPLPPRKHGLGWRPSFPDFRDVQFTVALKTLQNLPSKVDLRPQCPDIIDQKQIGSCTACALSAAVQFDRMKLGDLPAFEPSILFIYYNERALDGDVGTDGGSQLKTGMKTLSSQGVCSTASWPYIPDPPLYLDGPFPPGAKPATQPPQSCYNEAINYKIASYQAPDQSLGGLRGTLASGFPFVFGFTVYASWYTDSPATNIPLPSGVDSVVAGHAVMCVGYDDSTSMFTLHNSWGTDLGDAGYFYMPYAYMTDQNLTSDFWVVQTTTA